MSGPTEAWWENLDSHAQKIYSQSGEEGILRWLVAKAGAGGHTLVDIGAGDGFTLSNTRTFIEQGWEGFLFDVGHHDGVHHAFFTGENAADILAQHNVPFNFALLSLDIDGQDFWVLQKILQSGYRPNIIVAEINGSRPRWPSVTVPFYPPFAHDGTNYYGMSLGAVEQLGRHFGYTLVHQRMSLNAFLVQETLLPVGCEPVVKYTPNHGHLPDTQHRPWHEVTAEDLRR